MEERFQAIPLGFKLTDPPQLWIENYVTHPLSEIITFNSSRYLIKLRQQ